jgi:hypothetical protein
MGRSPPARGWCLALLVPLAALTGACGGESADSRSSPTSASPSSSDSASATTAPVATAGTVASSPASTTIAADAPLTQTVPSKFDPPFTVRIPADWTAVLRDRWAFQTYAGNEDYEITFDHTYQTKESVADGINRLKRTKGLEPEQVMPIVVGGRHGKAFAAQAQSAVQFPDSGFHTNDAAKLEVMVIPAQDGTTITVFLTAGGDPAHGLDVLAPLARRILTTVEWQSA